MSNYIFNTNTDVYSKLVYAAIKKYSNNEGRCFPSRNTLAQLCKISLSTLRKAINNLVDANILDKEYRYRENRSQTSNLYTLTPFMISGDYYFKVRADIFELNLSGNETVVYMYLCSCSNKESECYPSIRQIAAACGIGQTSVKSAIKGLIDKNLINKINQFRVDGGKRNNLYKIVSVDQDLESIENSIEPRPIIEELVHDSNVVIDDTCVEYFVENEKHEVIKIEDVLYDYESMNTDIENQNFCEMIDENTESKIRGDIFDFKLSKNSLMVYLYISTHNEFNKGKNQSYKQITQNCKISKAEAINAMLELKNYGLINKLMQDKVSNTMVVTKPPPWTI